MTIDEKAASIVADIKKEKGISPVAIFRNIAKKEYINIHGPEHHILDGASILVAYKNAGGNIDGTGPLSDDGTWGSHMEYTSAAIGELGKINGPRCCKRDAMIAFKNGVDYINKHYDVHLEYEKMACDYSALNAQCIKERCPFYG